MNAMTIRQIVGMVDPRDPALVKYFPNSIPFMLASDSSQIMTRDIPSTSTLLSANSGLPIMYVKLMAKNVRNEAYQKTSAVQCSHETMNPYFVP